MVLLSTRRIYHPQKKYPNARSLSIKITNNFEQHIAALACYYASVVCVCIAAAGAVAVIDARRRRVSPAAAVQEQSGCLGRANEANAPNGPLDYRGKFEGGRDDNGW